jgi:hypothetical protein
MRKNQDVEEKKPFLFRDGVLLVIAAVGSGVLLHIADTPGPFDTAFAAWGYLLGGIALVILLSMVMDAGKKKPKKP